MMKELSIYIHIPFCVRKCLYCDFLSFPMAKDTDLWKKADIRLATDVRKCRDKWKTYGVESYVNLLCREITQSAEVYKKYRVISIFLGGGTPSLLPADLISRIMETVRANYRMAENAEVTMEMNPGTIENGEPEQYITCGINRVSIGLQSADDEELRRIGRIHDYASFLKTYDLVRGAGFRNVNIDIMAALPGQDTASYERTLRKVTALAPEHISAYSLILEEGTPLYERQSEYSFPTEEEDQEIDRLTRQYLDSCGYHRYEISNYAKDGYECRHNKVYWQRGDYVGFGLGASSMVQNVRWSNPDTMERYAMYVMSAESKHGDDGAEYGRLIEVNGQGEPETGYIPYRQVLSRQEQMEEYMFLGLRMVCGVSAAKFEHIFDSPIEDVYGETIERLRQQGLLVRDGDEISLTERGLDVSNYAMSQFLFD
ncbi:MAG: radical SAM family heme chaperone HemW [Lachnospiraceae bacterium]|nr:radical SAM family heme chaperone HemW [Lachnospiraceae bacterium]